MMVTMTLQTFETQSITHIGIMVMEGGNLQLTSSFLTKKLLLILASLVTGTKTILAQQQENVTTLHPRL